jgi:hypothetical protein
MNQIVPIILGWNIGHDPEIHKRNTDIINGGFFHE